MNPFFTFFNNKKENKVKEEFVYAEIQDYVYEHKKENDDDKEYVTILQIT